MLVHLVTRKKLADAATKFKEAAKELGTWEAVVLNARWRNFVEVREVFQDADAADGYVIFNIRRNRYRLVTVIHYAKDTPTETQGHVYVRSMLTHADYDSKSKWDPFAAANTR